MDPGLASRIFEPFFSTKEAAGTGLGLPVVQKVIRAHNGKIDVDSRPSEGTTFTITLQAVRSIALKSEPASSPVTTER